MKRADLAIINRSFWPDNQVIGEALLQFAEKASERHKVCVITQSSASLRRKLDDKGRGESLSLSKCRALTNSSSGLLLRALELIYFTIWTFISLLIYRPKKVYVSTDPPILVPFVVFVYCKIFRANFYYHLQDIHPEITNIVVSLNSKLFKLLRWLDNYTVRNAKKIITLSNDMKEFLILRCNTKAPIELLDNPAFEAHQGESKIKNTDIVYCGNAGRLQRIPLLIESIRTYINQSGKMNFTFIGAGIYSSELELLANEFQQVSYFGFLPAVEASKIVSRHRWALLPIEDEVARYAFPSKSSSYVMSGCNILSICNVDTAVARWVCNNNLGETCAPEVSALVSCLFEIEKNGYFSFKASSELLENLDIKHFVSKLNQICGLNNSV